MLILALRFMLAAENKRRNAEPYDDTYDNVYILGADSDGRPMEKKVDKVCRFRVDFCLDLLHFHTGIPRPHRQAKS